jgi:hypothetical protein
MFFSSFSKRIKTLDMYRSVPKELSEATYLGALSNSLNPRNPPYFQKIKKPYNHKIIKQKNHENP